MRADAFDLLKTSQPGSAHWASAQRAHQIGVRYTNQHIHTYMTRGYDVHPGPTSDVGPKSWKWYNGPQGANGAQGAQAGAKLAQPRMVALARGEPDDLVWQSENLPSFVMPAWQSIIFPRVFP
jgi:hypothetical protein